MFALEKRGYVKAGPWTPECVLETPDAGNFLDFFQCQGLSFFNYLRTVGGG